MNLTKGVIIRSVAIVLLSAICLGSVLYVDGVFEFSFIDRHNLEGTATTSDANTTDADSLTSEITGTTDDPSSSETENPGTTDPVSTEVTNPPETNSGTVTPPNVFSPLGVHEYASQGYGITYKKYNSGMVLAEVTLPGLITDKYAGYKFFRKCVDGYLYSDETFRYADMLMTESERFSLEAYMGYILISSGEIMYVYDGLGNLLFETTERLSPAYTRDKQDRPLYFINHELRFYYIDFDQKILVEATEYNDKTDNRGLYFNYNPMFGKSDNKYEVSAEEREYQKAFTMTMDVEWHRFNVSPLIAKDLLLMYPKYAELVAKVNKRFAAALAVAKAEVAEEASRTAPSAPQISPSISIETEANVFSPSRLNFSSGDAGSTDTSPEISVTEETLSPEEPTSESESQPSPESSSESESTPEIPTEPNVDETTVSPEGSETPSEGTTETPTEEPSDSFPESSSEPAPESSSESASETPAEVTTEAPTETPEESTTETPTTEVPTTETPTTVAPETTSPYPSDRTEGTITITKTLKDYFFGYKNGATLAVEHKYSRAYAFNNGRAAVVDENGRLGFLNSYLYRTVWLRKSFKEPIVQGGDTYTWYVQSYYEPVIRDFSAIGSYYYDSGYVMVRHVSVETMRDKRIGFDQNILIDVSGNKVDPPSGFSFVSCTEGIMLVEKDGRYGYYDLKNDSWLTNPIYAYAEPFYEGVAVVGNGTSFGAIDTNGNEVLPMEFEYVSTMSSGLISTFSGSNGWRVFAKMAK